MTNIIGAAEVEGAKAPFEEGMEAYRERSFSIASKLFETVDLNTVSEDVKALLPVLQLNCELQISLQSRDRERINKARSQLKAHIDTIIPHNDLWATGMVYLGESMISGNYRGNGDAYFEPVLDYWANSTDLPTAKKQYLEVFWKYMGNDPFRVNFSQSTGRYIKDALKLVETQNEQATLHAALAYWYQRRGRYPDDIFLTSQEYTQAVQLSTHANEYRDRILYEFANQQANEGKWEWNGDNYQIKPDYEKALELYRLLMKEYPPKTSKYHDYADQGIKNITGAALNAEVTHIFLPPNPNKKEDIPSYFTISARNTEEIHYSVYQLNLVDHYNWGDIQKRQEANSALEKIDISKLALQTTGTISAGAPYEQIRTNVTLAKMLPAGAYLLNVQSSAKDNHKELSTRSIILVSDIGTIAKSNKISQTEEEYLVFVGNVCTGIPVPNATVRIQKLLFKSEDKKELRHFQDVRAQTDENGIAKLTIKSPNDQGYYGNALLTATIKSEDGNTYQTYNTIYPESYWNTTTPENFYVFTDRPAYRPSEGSEDTPSTVQWKVIVRKEQDGLWITPPSGTKYAYQITDPRGNKVKEGTITMNDFGSANGDLTLSKEMPLGEYHIAFLSTEKNNEYLSGNELFRLEEYVLPEFWVHINPEKGENAAYRIGDTVTATVEVGYYSGGVVANADVDVRIYSTPYTHTWKTPRLYPWMGNDAQGWKSTQYRRNRTHVLSKKYKTDVNGKAEIRFETPLDSDGDLEYTIEVDAAGSTRRIVSASTKLHVTRQSYYVQIKPEQQGVYPKQEVSIVVQAENANALPVETSGEITIQKRIWTETWRNPLGETVKANSTANIPNFDARTWVLIKQEYCYEDTFHENIQIGSTGRTNILFTPQKTGCYVVKWKSRDTLKLASGEQIPWTPINTETVLWCADESTKTLEEHNTSKLQLQVGKTEIHPGDTLPVLLRTDHKGQTVLFTVEATGILYQKVVRMTGDTELIELPISDAYSPNVWIMANCFHETEICSASEQILVPAEKHFLKVEITPETDKVEPRSTSKVRLRTTDIQGNPISSEVAIGVADESIYTIQDEYAKDPREQFYGTLRNHEVQTHSYFVAMYYHPVETADIEEAVVASDGMLRRFRTTSTMNKAMMGAMMEAAPAPAPMAAAKVMMDMSSATPTKEVAMAAGADMDAVNTEEEAVTITVRNDFRGTAFWNPAVQTDENGVAEIEVPYPDNLTQWRITARANTKGSDFGIQTSNVQTIQPLTARLQAPRFFTEGDIATVSGLIQNNTDSTLTARVSIDTDIDMLEILGDKEQEREIAAGGECVVDWNVKANRSGDIRINIQAKSAKYADAMEKRYTIYEHGMEQFIAQSGKLTEGEATILFTLPEQRKAAMDKITLSVTPSLAATMLDALPYLFDYPYGCAEQTMSRFLPAVIVANTLASLGLSAEDIDNRLFCGRETNVAPNAGDRKSFSQLDKITQTSLDRLYDMQQNDGGWGWWKETDTDVYMTAYVVWGLSLATQSGIEIRNEALNRGANWLKENLLRYNEQPSLQCWILHALSATGKDLKDKNIVKTFDTIYGQRQNLDPYSRALLTIVATQIGKLEEAKVLARNLQDGVIIDDTPSKSALNHVVYNTSQNGANDLSTAHWGGESLGWHWYDNQIETTACALFALLKANPESELIQPTVNWLIKNRRGTQWNNTRDTAITILALTQYLKNSKEMTTDISFVVEANNTTIDTRLLHVSDLTRGQYKIDIPAEKLKNGENEIKIVKQSGEAPLYFALNAQYYTQEKPISAVGNEIFVKRQYYKKTTIPTLLRNPSLEKTLLNDGDSVQSGDIIEVVLTIEAKNDYEYLLFEDIKPAGCESTQVHSGGGVFARQLSELGVLHRASNDLQTKTGDTAQQGWFPWFGRLTNNNDYTGRQRWLYQEQRDHHIATFIDNLTTGVWEITYDLRAETPGDFQAMPTMGQAMYVPELRCNSNEIQLKILIKNK